MSSNTFSPTWYAVFLDTISQDQTAAEVAFLRRQLPQPRYHVITDLCCGSGRHSRLLASYGYEVTGVDWNGTALAEAQDRDGDAVTYIQADMRRLSEIDGSADALICLWQSFGYFDDATNALVVRQIAARLVDGGRFVLDVYNREHFEGVDRTRTLFRGNETITQTSRYSDRRLMVDMQYAASDATDRADWRLYTEGELESICGEHGLRMLLACADWKEDTRPARTKARMQLVFEKDQS